MGLTDRANYGPWPAVSASMVFGLVLGTFFTSTWQVAVETAQVLAGIVEYPIENAFYRYHLSAWSLAHQVLAGILWLGADERSVSIALSGMLTGAMFGGLALCSHAICRNTGMAILAPLFWFASFRDANAYGVSYPLVLTGTHHTYGLLGSAAALWLAGLAAHGYLRSAFFLAGLIPSLHLTWGLFGVVVVGVAWGLTTRDRRAAITRWPWLFAGVGFSALSLAIQQWWIRGLPAVEATDAETYLQAFLTYWDGHRTPVSVLAPGTLLIGVSAACAISIVSLERVKDSARTMLTIAIVAGVAGIVLLLLTQFPSVLPTSVAVAMPGRFANFALLLTPCVLAGSVGLTSGRAFSALTGALIVYVLWNWCFLTFLSSDKYGWELGHWKFLTVMLALAAVLVRQSPASNARGTGITSMAVLILAAGILIMPKMRAPALIGTTEDPVVEYARGGSGLIITGPGLELMQLRTGRPILLNTGGLDQLPYVPSSGPAMNDALQRAYGVSIIDPPQVIRDRRVGALPRDWGIDLFAQRSVEDWQTIAKHFGHGAPVSVLVRNSHELSWPPVASSDEFSLYEIPSTEKE